MNYQELADLLFPKVNQGLEDLEKQYPPRALPEGAKVTRMAPSPTGFMHLGNLFGAITDERLAHQSQGVFFLRIEDTDQKREVEGGVQTILDVFQKYKLPFDEGATLEGGVGAYGPYYQRRRADIYHVCAKQLVLKGLAYPCFMTEEELAQIREEQAAQKLNFGCYGDFAKYRNASIEEIQGNIQAGKPYVVRFRSPGDLQNRIKVADLIRGTLELPENDQDVVLLKADGIPTYHFAHVVDDHFMRTNIVVRGEEWLATLPIHVQLFSALGWKVPKYLHTSHLMKMDGESRRKLSKRKDPELALTWYSEQGYPVTAVKEYLLTLLNSNFEDWRAANPQSPLEDFPFSAKKMSVSGALFDTDKLNDVSRGVISRMTAEELYQDLLEWALEQDGTLAELLQRDKDLCLGMMNIGRGGKKPRKDLTIYSEAKEYYSFFFDELFQPDYQLPDNVSSETAADMLRTYTQLYDPAADQNGWFSTVKELARTFQFADDMKAYKQDPSAYPGSVADVSMVLRLAITGRPQSPDLWEVMQVLGLQKVQQRLQRMIQHVS